MGDGERDRASAQADAGETTGTPGGREGEPARGLSRRRALQVLAAGAAGAAALPAAGCVPTEEAATTVGATPSTGATTGAAAPAGQAPPASGNPLARGTPTDPDLLSPVVPWNLVLTDDELRTLAALCDLIIPADERSPAASDVGAHEFIDEWVSAPYDGNREDLVLIRGGIVWLDRESAARFERRFVDLSDGEKRAIADDICYEPNARPEHLAAARFFDRVRDLASTAFWTTEEGMADLGFVGNRPMTSFDGPPPEVLERLGLV